MTIIINTRADLDALKGTSDYLPALQAELMAVISKYVQVSQEDIKVQLERQDNLDVLEVNIVLNEPQRPAA